MTRHQEGPQKSAGRWKVVVESQWRNRELPSSPIKGHATKPRQK